MNNVIVVGMMSALKHVVTRQGLQMDARTIIPGAVTFLQVLTISILNNLVVLFHRIINCTLFRVYLLT